jgi:hypothetical protein
MGGTELPDTETLLTSEDVDAWYKVEVEKLVEKHGGETLLDVPAPERYALMDEAKQRYTLVPRGGGKSAEKPVADPKPARAEKTAAEPSPSSSVSDVTSDKPYECAFKCGIRAKTTRGLKQHYDRVHPGKAVPASD